MQLNAKRDAPKRNPQSTKAGPGRRHVSGHQKSSPVPSKGAPLGFVQHTNAAKKNRRDSIAAIGRRQFLKLTKAARRAGA